MMLLLLASSAWGYSGVVENEALRQNGVAMTRVPIGTVTEEMFDAAKNAMTAHTWGDSTMRIPFHKTCHLTKAECRALTEIPEVLEGARYVVGPEYAPKLRLWGLSLIYRKKGDRQRVHSMSSTGRTSAAMNRWLWL